MAGRRRQLPRWRPSHGIAGISLVLDADRPQRKLQSCCWSGPRRPLPEAARAVTQEGVRRFFGRGCSSFQQG